MARKKKSGGGAFAARLKKLQSPFKKATKSGFSAVPDGNYIGRLVSMSLSDNNKNDELRLMSTWCIIKGDHTGENLGLSHTLENEDYIGYTKAYLAMLSVDVDDLDLTDIEDVLQQLVQERLGGRLSVKTKDTYSNARLTRVIELEDDDEEDEDVDDEEETDADTEDESEDEDSAEEEEDEDEDGETEEEEEDEEEETEESDYAPKTGDLVEVDFDGTVYKGTVKKVNSKKQTAKVEFEDGIEVVAFDEMTATISDDEPVYRDPSKGDAVAWDVKGKELRGTVVKYNAEKELVTVKQKKTGKKHVLDLDSVDILIDQE